MSSPSQPNHAQDVSAAERSGEPFPGLTQPPLPLPLRYVIGVAVVGLWMAIGFTFNIGGASSDASSTYLLVGVPITILFQLFANRLPVPAMWVRAATEFRLDREGIIIGVLLAIYPVVDGVQNLITHTWVAVLYCAATIVGAFGAAFALRRMRRTTWRQLVYCLATAGLIGIILTVLNPVIGVHLVHKSLPNLAIHLHLAHRLTSVGLVTGIGSFLLYVPTVFVVEEVFFRGVLDTFVYRPEDGTGAAWWGSAALVSLLWGTWHLPVYWHTEGLRALPHLWLIQGLVGIPLSIWWRKSGNLVVTGTTHALIDSVRNALGVPV